MIDPAPPTVLDEMREYVERLVQGGFMPVGEIPEAAVEYMAGDAAPEALRPHAEQFTADSLVGHAEEQETWPAVTDCDRLDAAFESLDAAGILAGQDFSCCQTCGHAEMRELVQEAEETGRPVRGYAFYHAQDTESAVEGGSLFIAWGAVAAGAEAVAGIGREVAQALRAEGLTVHWEGDPKRRIEVALLWQRRRE
jgi:hypothetical protein